MIVAFYTLMKAGWSWLADRAAGNVARRPVPRYNSPEAAAGFLMTNCVYTGDPGKGAVDYSINPDRLQAAMESGPEAFKRLHVDCDDYAAWAVAALRLMGADAHLITLRCRLDMSKPWEESNWGHHVIAVAAYKGRFLAIDTNGLRDLPDVQSKTLCDVWSAIYASRRYVYEEAVVSANPF